MINRKTPLIKLATHKPAGPKVWATGYKITTKAAVGPETLKREPPVNEITKPATSAVYSTYSGLTPLAIANAIANGIAIIPTVIPAIISRIKRLVEYGSLIIES